MKLHLPTRLRKALIASFVALASLATTLSSATLIGGVAAVSLSASSVAQAAVVGPAESYAAGTVPTDFPDNAATLTATEDTSWDLTGVTLKTLTISAEGADVKLLGRQNSDGGENFLENVVADSVWAASGCFQLDKDSDFASAGDIYVGGGQIQFAGNMTLSNDFTVGTTSINSGFNSLNTAFRVGINSKSGVVAALAGNVDIQEDTSIGYQNNATLNFSGTLTGSGNIQLSSYNGANTLIFSGDSSAFTGAIISSTNGVTIKLGAAQVQFGGLEGSSAVALDAVASSTLTLNVAESAAYTYTGTLAAGINIVKDGAGTQTIDSALSGSVTVNAGALSLTDISNVTAITVKSGAMLALNAPIVVSSTATSWVQGKSYYTASAGDIDESLMTLEEGALVVSNGGQINAGSGKIVYAETSCLSRDGELSITGGGSLMVSNPTNITQVADSVAAASRIVLDNATLLSISHEDAGEESLNYLVGADLEILSGGAVLQVDGTDAADITTYAGVVRGSGNLTKRGSGRAVLSGGFSGYSGSINIEGGALEIAGDMTLSSMISGNNGTLVLNGNIELAMASGDQQLRAGNVNVAEGSTIRATKTDSFSWGSNVILTLEKDSEFDCGALRQTMGRVTLVLNGGSIIGQGVSNGEAGTSQATALDYHQGNTVIATDDSVLGATSRLNNSGRLTIQIAPEKQLVWSGEAYGNGNVALDVINGTTSAGELVVSAAHSYAGGTTINAGTVKLQEAGALGTGAITMAANTNLIFANSGDVTHANAITGDAASRLVIDGSGTTTLSTLETFDGTITLSGGVLDITRSATIGKLEGDGGALLVDAAAERLISLSSYSGKIILNVTNADSIGEDGVRVFVGNNKPADGDVKIESFITADTTMVATYSDGKLIKSALAAVQAGDLIWMTDGVSNNWGTNTTAENWDNNGAGQRWADNSVVTFAGDGETITLTSAVTAESATVSGTGYEWVLGTDKLTINEGVTIEAGADLTINGATSTNFSGVVSGAGTLKLLNTGIMNLKMSVVNNFVFGPASGSPLDTLVLGEGAHLELGNSDHQAAIDNITNLVVAEGGQFDLRHAYTMNAGDNNKTITIAGTGSGLEDRPAAALTFCYAAMASETVIGRTLMLSDDATIYVAANKTGKLTGSVDAAGHELTVIGGGTLKMEPASGKTLALADVSIQEASTLYVKTPSVQMGNVSLGDGSTLTLYRDGNGVQTNPVSSNQKFTIEALSVTGTTTLKGTHHSACFEIGNLAGSGTLNVDANHTSSIVYSTFVNGEADFAGTVNLSVTNNTGSRSAVFGTADHDALSGTVVNFETVTNAGSKAGFILANTENHTIQVAGLSTAENIAAGQALIVSNDGVSIASDGDMRTLEIVGSGEQTFAGTVLAGVSLLMNGEGTQTFAGNMDAFNGTVEVQKGTLNMANLGGASAITLAGAGSTLGVTTGVSGKTLIAKETGAVLSADLTLAGGSLTLGADKSWAQTGGLSLNSHKLVLDADNKGSLAIDLSGYTAYSGDVIELLTNVSSIEGADFSTLVKVGSLFDTGEDSVLADYLLLKNGNTLALVMKGEIADLEWDDDDTDNVWQSGSESTNWFTDTQTDCSFSVGDNVNFVGGGDTVTVSGTVKPNDIQVCAPNAQYTWDGTGSIEASGKLVIGSEGSPVNTALYIANTGSKKFAGGVEVKEGALLTLYTPQGWEGKVSGAGSFVIDSGATLDLSQFIDASETAPTLGSLSLGSWFNRTTLVMQTEAAVEALSKVQNVLQLCAVLDADVTASFSTPADVQIVGTSIVDVAAGKTLTMDAHLNVGKGSYSSLGASLQKKGTGTLVLSQGMEYTGQYSSVDIASGTLLIADEGSKADNTLGSYSFKKLQPLATGGGAVILQNGSVLIEEGGLDKVNDAALKSLSLQVATKNAGDVVQVSGINGSDIDAITLAKGTRLTGVTGDISVGGTGATTAMSLTIDTSNVGTSATIAAGKNAMIDQTGNLIINSGAIVNLSIDAITDMLASAAEVDTTMYLHLTTGTLSVADGELSNLKFLSNSTSVDLLQDCGVRLSGVSGGSLVLKGGAEGIYTIEKYDSVAEGYRELASYQATVVTAGKTLELKVPGASPNNETAVVNNLLGGTGSTFLINNTSTTGEVARVELVNAYQDITDANPAAAKGADTEFAGDIDATAGAGDVDLIISGNGTLTVGGDLTSDTLTMAQGGLTLLGDGNVVDTLTDDGVADDATAADATLTVDGLLTVKEDSAMTGTSLAGAGTLALEKSLKISEAAQLDGVTIDIVKNNFGAAGELMLDGVTDAEVAALNGAGSLQGGQNAELTVTGNGGSFSGTLAAIEGAESSSNLLKIAEGASQTLDRVTGSTNWSVENAGDLTINITNPAVTTGTGTNKVLTLDTLTMKSDSTTTLVINSDVATNYLNLNNLVIEDGATLALVSTGLNDIEFDGSLTLAQVAEDIVLGDDVTVDLGTSSAFKKVKEATLIADGKNLTLQTTYHTQNQYANMATSGNSMAGAAMLWSVNTGSLPSGSALKAVDEAVHALQTQGTAGAAAKADQVMAAVAGSSTAILGSALSSDVERQLRAIRNRTTTMGVSQAAVNENMPYYNAWINAEGDHHELSADGLAAGYTRDSWGGTVGFDVDITPALTMGVALTAMYGDVDSDAADKAEGDFDTQYVSLFARYTSDAWVHTFVATVGRADITLNRTVDFGVGSYETKGETEGTAIAFMYEAGRVYSLTEDGDVCLQPVFNVSFRHSTVDGYTEEGCDAALEVGKQTATSLTFGAGARMQAVVGTSIYNRASIFEARALVKLDAGDREGEADVRLLQGGAQSSVKSAELGVIGLEVGAGITIPMGMDAGAIFVDASAELRSGYTNVNGTVGYRVNF